MYEICVLKSELMSSCWLGDDGCIDYDDDDDDDDDDD